MERKHLLAVYDTLRRGCSSEQYLAKATFLGEFDTEPKFDLFSFGSFCALKKQGNISVRMEVYEIDDDILYKIDALRDFKSTANVTNYYDRIRLRTPFGIAYTYAINVSCSGKSRVDCGDWVEYKEKLKQEIENI